MSKISALDFGNYIKSCNNTLYSILQNKGMNLKNNMSLSTLISQVNNISSDSPYQMDSYMTAFEQSYQNDILRTKNGGQYMYTYFAILNCADDSTIISKNTMGRSASVTALIVTSDGQTINQISNQDLTIVWDRSKDNDNKLDDNTPVRWIKIYTSTIYTGGEGNDLPCCSPENSSSRYGRALMLIKDNDTYTTRITSSYENNCNNCYCYPLQVVIFGDNIVTLYGSSLLRNCKELKYVKAYNVLNQYSNNYSGTNYSLSILGGPIKLDVKIGKLYSLNQLTINGANTDIHLDLSQAYTADDAQSASMSNATIGSIIYPNYLRLIPMPLVLTKQKVLVLPKSATATITISGSQLTDILFPSENDYTSITLSNTPRLNKSSILNLFDVLPDKTNSSAGTITLDRKMSYILSNDEKLIAINKNWTLSFAYES